MQKSQPTKMKVSVSIITYNHEAFIGDAIESVLRQNVDFDYEIVIGDDCSTDRTREILLEYQERYPDRIQLVLQPSNAGGQANFIATLDRCIGEYVAILDGDDFWTSPDKLQRQVEFLDSHPDCSMCFHDLVLCFAGEPERLSSPLHRRRKPKDKVFTLKDLLLGLGGRYIPFSSVMTRRENVMGEHPDGSADVPTDWMYHFMAAKRGNLGYVDEPMVAYRVHHRGSWSSRGGIRQLSAQVHNLRAAGAQLGSAYRPIMQRSLARLEIHRAYAYACERLPRDATASLRASLQLTPLVALRHARFFFATLMRVYAPFLQRPVRALRDTLVARR